MTIEEIEITKQTLTSSMKDYINIFKEDNREEPYSPADANKCGVILDTYLSYLFSTKRTNKEILSQVEIVVKELNKLNEKCNYCMIETEEREQLCTIIIDAARLCGYQFPIDDDDITFEWREW